MRVRTRLLICVAGLVALALPSVGLGAVTNTPPPPVVGAGTIDVPVLPVYAEPSRSSRVLARLTEFREQDYRPRSILAIDTKTRVVTRKVGKKWKRTTELAWYRITVPGRPNGRRGWVEASKVTIRPMPWQVVVFRDSRVIQLWKGDAKLYQAKVAVGAPGMETPTGLYHVTVRFKPIRQTFLGTFAFELSAYSKLSEWPGGGVVGLHGTWAPQLLGQAVSHGCIRIANETANFLRDRIPVGTPIRVLAA